MTTPAPEVDIPSTNEMVLVCYACLGTRWQGPTQRLWTVTLDGVDMPEVQDEIGDWHCGDCGHHKALLVSREDLVKVKAEREASG